MNPVIVTYVALVLPPMLSDQVNLDRKVFLVNETTDKIFLHPSKLLTAANAELTLIEFHAPDGLKIDVNVVEISSVREPRHEVHSSVGCLLVMTNKSFISVKESCEDVLQKLSATRFAR
jgi:hypothetical protein